MKKLSDSSDIAKAVGFYALKMLIILQVKLAREWRISINLII